MKITPWLSYFGLSFPFITVAWQKRVEEVKAITGALEILEHKKGSWWEARGGKDLFFKTLVIYQVFKIQDLASSRFISLSGTKIF